MKTTWFHENAAHHFNIRPSRSSHLASPPSHLASRFSPLASPLSLLFLAALTVQGAEYDPLKLPANAPIRTQDFTIKDISREREIPIKVYYPPSATGSGGKESAGTDSHEKLAVPVVLFSHGLGGNREGSAFLGKHWASRGYVAVFVQHPGSDDSVWRDAPLLQRMKAMQEAASGKNLLLRIKDIPAVIDQLEVWNRQADHPLSGRVDTNVVGMSGHSFGAQTTQSVSGQSFGLLGPRATDPRIKAAVVMSPGVPPVGDPQRAFGDVKVPWLLMTGTHDSSPIGGQTPESRRKVFPALPPGDKFELVLDKGEHSAFTERALPGERQARNPNHHRVILALSTAFWDAYLRHDAAAKTWLTGDGPRQVLEAADLWEKK